MCIVCAQKHLPISKNSAEINENLINSHSCACGWCSTLWYNTVCSRYMVLHFAIDIFCSTFCEQRKCHLFRKLIFDGPSWASATGESMSVWEETKQSIEKEMVERSNWIKFTDKLPYGNDNTWKAVESPLLCVSMPTLKNFNMARVIRLNKSRHSHIVGFTFSTGPNSPN